MQLIFENVNGNDIIYMDCLKAICGNTEGKSLLDAMSNLAPHTPLLGFKERTYVDVLPRILDHKEEQQYFIQEDILIFLRDTNNTYDTCICSDGCEHLKEDDGGLLLALMEKVSKKQILFTPLGAHMVEGGDNPEAHHSAWLPKYVPDYACLIFPNYHPSLGIGSFFFWKCDNLEEDFERVANELKQKSWAK